MTKITLLKRELTGKKAKRLVNEGMVPAVIYNSKGDSSNVKCELGQVERLVRSATTSTIVDAELDGKVIKVLIKDVEVDPLKEGIRHIAFFEIDETKPMTFELPVHLIGVSPAVKNNLGVLVQPTQSITVRCALKNLVPSIDVDIATLTTPGQTILLSDLSLPEGVELVRKEDSEKALASVTQLQKLVEEETPAAADEAQEAQSEEAAGDEEAGQEA